VGLGSGAARVKVTSVVGLEDQDLLALDDAVLQSQIEIQRPWHHDARHARPGYDTLSADPDRALAIRRRTDVKVVSDGDLRLKYQHSGIGNRNPFGHAGGPGLVGNDNPCHLWFTGLADTRGSGLVDSAAHAPRARASPVRSLASARAIVLMDPSALSLIMVVLSGRIPSGRGSSIESEEWLYENQARFQAQRPDTSTELDGNSASTRKQPSYESLWLPITPIYNRGASTLRNPEQEKTMNRRDFATTTTLAALAAAVAPPVAEAQLPEARVTRIRIFDPPRGYRQQVNTSNLVITVDTNIGITGVGDGGSPDLIRGLAPSVIGKNPFDTARIWQYMYMDDFYSPGREKIHAIGGIDAALWDIKGKALGVPVYQLLGGRLRDHIELYTTPGLPSHVVSPGEAAGMSLEERAAATMESGYRVYRVDAEGTGPYGPAGIFFGGPIEDRVFDTRDRVPAVADACRRIRDGVGPNGDWMIDFHQKFDFNDALELCRMIEEYRPYCVEDPLREEQFRTQVPKLRTMTTCPLAPGEQWGQRWEFSTLIENRDIDYARASLPNVGGITEMQKIMALCETHTVGIIPHFTGPIATAANVHALMAFPGPVLMEYNNGPNTPDYLGDFVDFRDGKLWPNDRPGLGVTIESNALTLIEEFTDGGPGPGGRTYLRPDGSPTHW
jgi:galactonate dehydratase